MKKPEAKNYDFIKDYLYALELYVEYLEEKNNALENEIWEEEIRQRDEWARNNC